MCIQSKQENVEKKEQSSFNKEKFEEIKNQPATRKVTLSLKVPGLSFCGCGPGEDEYFDIEREVPFDSHYQDGDTTMYSEEGDVLL